MSDAPNPNAALAAMYPSASKPDASATPAADAKTTGSAAPSTPPAQPTKAPAPAPPAVPAQGTKQAPETPAVGEATSPAAAALYGNPACADDVSAAMALPDDLAAAGLEDGDTGNAARAEVRAAFLAAGATKEEVGQLWGIALEAARPGAARPTYEAAEAELRKAWGAEYDARLSRARTFARSIVKRSPRVAEHIASLDLGNNHRFIQAIEAAARRRRR